jgi:chromosome partitioning protein
MPVSDTDATVALRTGLPNVLAVCNGKGGTGKTAITANVAGICALSDYRVLVVDLDPQGDCSKEFGQSGVGGLALFQAVKAPQGSILQPVRRVRPNIDLIDGGEELEDLAFLARTWEGSRATAGTRFSEALRPLAGNYELIIIDCPPGHPSLQEMALSVARFALVPTRSDDFSIDGLAKIARRFRQARITNPDLELLGVVVFASDTRATRWRQRAADKVATGLGEIAPVFSSFIRYSEAAADDMRERRMLVHEYEHAALRAPRWFERRRGDTGGAFASTADGLAGDYQRLTAEILTAMAQRLGVSDATKEA